MTGVYLILWFRANLFGVMAESFLILFIGVFLCIIVGLRHYAHTYVGLHANVIERNSSILSAFIVFCGLCVYYLMVFWAPILFHNINLAVYSDGNVYLFRVILTTLFMLYYIYTAVASIHYSGYKFEYYFALLAAIGGLNLMLISADFLNLLLGMEIYSIAIYYLLSSKKLSTINNEAAMKYFLISSFSTAIFLFGVFVLYLGHGSYDYEVLFLLKKINFSWEYVGYFFVILALIVKIGGGLFYFWTLDSYEGGSFPILILLTIFVKPVFIFISFRIILFAGWPSLLQYLFAGLLLLSSLVGVGGAILETKLQRFFIFTSIYNLGFLGSFLWNPASTMFGGFILFFTIYAVNSLSLMLLICYFRYNNTQFPNDWAQVISMACTSKPMRFLLAFLLFSISGLPPFTFFFVKYYLFVKLFMQTYYIVLIYLLIVNAMALFLYIRLIRLIVRSTQQAQGFQVFFNKYIPGVLGCLTAFNIFLLFYFDQFLHFVNLFVSGWAF